MIQCLASSVIFGGKAPVATRLLASVLSRNIAPTSSVKTHEAIFRSPSFGIINTSRHLYSEASLRMEKLEFICENKKKLFVGPTRERYISRLEKYSEEVESRAFFKDDIVNLIGLAEEEKDLDLLEKLIVSIEPEQRSLFQGWGTTVMRLYYKMNQLERAFKNIKDVDRFGDFFSQRQCYKIVMTMLFNAGRYEDVIDTYQLANSRLTKSFDGPERYLATIVFAAYAKLNNPQALQKAQEFYSEFEQGVLIRPIQYLSYLAVNNGNPKYAINLISQVNKQPLTLKNLKIISLIKLERYEDILLQLREYSNFLRRDSFLLFKNTFDMIQNSLENLRDPAVRQELSDLLVEIKDGGHVSDATMEELLFKEINELPRPDFRNDSSFNRQRNQDDDSEDRPRYRQNYKPRQYNRDFDSDQRQERQYQRRSSGNRYTHQTVDSTS